MGRDGQGGRRKARESRDKEGKSVIGRKGSSPVQDVAQRSNEWRVEKESLGLAMGK